MKHSKLVVVLGLIFVFAMASMSSAEVHVDEYEPHLPDGQTVQKLQTINLAKLPHMKATTVFIKSNTGIRTSGVIIDAEKGLVLTCAHGTTNMSSVTVTMDDGQRFDAYQFQIKRFPKYDLALIRVGVRMGDTQAHIRKAPLRLGEEIIGIGTPGGFSYLFNSLSFGRVTGLDRKILKGQSPKGYDLSPVRLIQTNSSINPGNSGGPLFDVGGRVVGINIAFVNGYQDINWTVPAKFVLRILEEVK